MSEVADAEKDPAVQPAAGADVAQATLEMQGRAPIFSSKQIVTNDTSCNALAWLLIFAQTVSKEVPQLERSQDNSDTIMRTS